MKYKEIKNKQIKKQTNKKQTNKKTNKQKKTKKQPGFFKPTRLQRNRILNKLKLYFFLPKSQIILVTSNYLFYLPFTYPPPLPRRLRRLVLRVSITCPKPRDDYNIDLSHV
jgi:hypothetical protein